MQEHLAALRETLHTWASRVEDGMDEQTFVAAARYDVVQVEPELTDLYDEAAPFWHHYRGLARYWRKRRETSGVRLQPDLGRGHRAVQSTTRSGKPDPNYSR